MEELQCADGERARGPVGRVRLLHGGELLKQVRRPAACGESKKCRKRTRRERAGEARYNCDMGDRRNGPIAAGQWRKLKPMRSSVQRPGGKGQGSTARPRRQVFFSFPLFCSFYDGILHRYLLTLAFLLCSQLLYAVFPSISRLHVTRSSRAEVSCGPRRGFGDAALARPDPRDKLSVMGSWRFHSVCSSLPSRVLSTGMGVWAAKVPVDP